MAEHGERAQCALARRVRRHLYKLRLVAGHSSGPTGRAHICRNGRVRRRNADSDLSHLFSFLFAKTDSGGERFSEADIRVEKVFILFCCLFT